jgi:MscS family membrane protein
MRHWILIATATLPILLPARPLSAQTPPPRAEASPGAEADPLRRDTPRGTVLGFLEAARGGEYAVARQYLQTSAGPEGADRLARQLFVVLDARLPARLAQVSDEPGGSRADVLHPTREFVGTIAGRQGEVEIYVERSTRGRTEGLWLFPDAALAPIPALYEEVAAEQRQTAVPRFLTERRAIGLRLLDWLVLLGGLPLFFVATAMLNRLLRPVMRPVWRRFGAEPRDALPAPARLLVLALTGRWMLSWLPLSLMARQFWSAAAGVISIVAIVWLLIRLNGAIETVLRRRLPPAGSGAGATLLLVLRRVADAAMIVAGFLVLLWRFGIDPTPAVAGLGVGGIAVALAAQKTLDNVIAGASLIFDQAVRVGDYLRVGAFEGTVDHIGLRSTRIRTPDRTLVTVPNGQIATLSLETVSARDKYWFHPDVRVRYDATPRQLHDVLADIRRLLDANPAVDGPTSRVRLVGLGPYSYDIAIFAYVAANDLPGFLEVQEALLFGVTEAVERAGASLGLPLQAMSLTGGDRAHAVLPSMPAGVS